MTLDEAKNEIAELRQQLAEADRLYHGKAKPLIPDFEYDKKKKRLADIEVKFPELVTEDSPTQRVGDDRTEGFTRAKHRQAMTTLDNTYDEAELREFDFRLAKLVGKEVLVYSVEPKIDGASISLTYEHGRLVRAVTRGDGEEGDDVTANVLVIANLPHVLQSSAEVTPQDVPTLIEIRGEIFMRFEEFARINQAQVDGGFEPYANPRNLAAGTLKLLDSSVVRSRKLEIVLYGLGACEPALLVDSQAGWHVTLRQWGLPTLEHRKLTRGIEETLLAIREIDAFRSKLSYATDGAVVKLDDFNLQSIAGYRGEEQRARKLSPRWACAYKFAPERAETELQGITIQVGRTGVLTPVAELKAVPLAGSTVARATLHNRDEIARKDIRIGDYVVIEKAGEIIPAVIEVNLKRRSPTCVPYIFPTKCPVCSTLVIQIDGEVAVRCPNPDCPAQLVGRLDYIAGRSVFDIEGLGGAVAEKLVEKGLVRDFFDLFGIEHEKLARLERSESTGLKKSGEARKAPEVGDSNARRILTAIERTRSLALSRWILAMQIRDVGGATAQDIEKIHGSMDAIAGSQVLRDIAEFGRLSELMLKHSPTARVNLKKEQSERDEMKPAYEDYKKRADEMGLKLVASGYAKFAEKPLHESIPIGDSPEANDLKLLLAEMSESDSSSKENKGKSADEWKQLDREYATAKDRAEKLAREMIARGLAKRATRPPRDALPAIGPVVAQSVVNWIESKSGKHFLERFKEMGITPSVTNIAPNDTPFSGKTVVLTGTLVSMSRDEAKAKVHKFGGNVVGSVSRKTDLVIAGPGAGAKLDDARKYGVKVITENEFLEMLGTS